MKNVKRTYAVDEVEELVSLLGNNPVIPAERYAGMLDVLLMLRHFEGMSDAGIEAEVRSIYISLPK